MGSQVYMKGTKEMPQCGFSANVVKVCVSANVLCLFQCTVDVAAATTTARLKWAACPFVVVVKILSSLNAPYETVNILENELLRSGMKEYSQWPTFPQVYIDQEFFGGCDIMIGKPHCKACGRLRLHEALLGLPLPALATCVMASTSCCAAVPQPAAAQRRTRMDR